LHLNAVQQELFPKSSGPGKVSPGSGSSISSQNCAELPEGFTYQDDFITLEEEQQLLKQIRQLEFQPFDFHGYIAKRRIVEYGFEYDFDSRRTSQATPIPAFLEFLKERAAAWAGIAGGEIIEAVVTEYPPGAPIGWHRDVPQFEKILGVSLKSSCRMRFKPYRAKGKVVPITLEPRSIYRMEGPARWKYQHSIPAVKELRYSITFRTARGESRHLAR
jgi:alkylated DNA repair dioxygenase AlkB